MENRLENKEETSDRRVFERIPVSLPARFKNNTRDTEGKCFCGDISAGGAGVFSKEKVELNDKLDLWLEASGRGDPLQFSGEVVWVKETQPQVWKLGIQFSDVRFMDLSMILRAAQ